MKRLGIKVREVRSIGGGARSGIWCRIKSDILQLPIVLPAEEETACLGAAILAGVASGIYGSLRDAVKTVIRVKDRISPSEENKTTYDKLYEVYIELYEKLKDVFPKLADTGKRRG